MARFSGLISPTDLASPGTFPGTNPRPQAGWPIFSEPRPESRGLCRKGKFSWLRGGNAGGFTRAIFPHGV